jgi:hypothetical protein
MGLSLMRRGLVDRAGPAVRDPADPVDLAVLDRVGLGLAVPVDLAVLGRADQGMDRGDPVDRAGRVDLDLEDRVDLAVLGRADQGMDRGDPVDRAGRVDLDLEDRAVLVGLGRVGPVDQGMDRVDRAVLVGLDLADLVGRVAQAMNPAGRVDLVDLVDRAGLAIRADRKRRTRPEVLSTGVGPRWAAPGMCRTASAPPTTVHRLRPDNTDGAGMAGPRPERNRLGGTDRRPRVVGADRRLPVVGTVHGMVRRVTGASRNAISGRSITTGTTRSRCSTRFSGDGASGSSDSGFRCTETT